MRKNVTTIPFAIWRDITQLNKIETLLFFLLSKFPPTVEAKRIFHSTFQTQRALPYSSNRFGQAAEGWIPGDERWIWKIFCGPVKCDSAGLAQDLTLNVVHTVDAVFPDQLIAKWLSRWQMKTDSFTRGGAGTTTGAGCPPPDGVRKKHQRHRSCVKT